MVRIEHNASANPINNCRYNERYLLHVLRIKHKESKANLARETGLTAAAVGGIISSLQQKGLVEVVGKVQGDMGQPATLFSLAKEGAYGLGVSINRGHIETALINFVGDVVNSKKHVCILSSPEEVLNIVLNDIDDLVNHSGFDKAHRIAGIGVAQPYNFTSSHRDEVNWDAWDDYDLAGELQRATGLNAHVQNDANAAAIAELIYGKGAESRDFVYLFMGSAMVMSLGGAVVLDGACRNGTSGNAGDIGLMPLPNGNIETSHIAASSATTFLTNRCSLYSLVRYLRSKACRVQHREDLDSALQSHANDVSYWVQDCAAGLETAIQSIQALIDVPEIIIDCEDEDALVVRQIIETLNQQLNANASNGLTVPVVSKGCFGSNAAAIGAATLPLDWSFSPKATQ